MKKQFYGILLAILLPNLVVAKAPNQFEKIVASKAYKSKVNEAKKAGSDFYCAGIAETLQTSDYSNFPGMETRFQLVVLDCHYNPHDGGDAIRQAGLVVMAGSEVLSFAVGSVAQPD
jgi:hypothetical protein